MKMYPWMTARTEMNEQPAPGVSQQEWAALEGVPKCDRCGRELFQVGPDKGKPVCRACLVKIRERPGHTFEVSSCERCGQDAVLLTSWGGGAYERKVTCRGCGTYRAR